MNHEDLCRVMRSELDQKLKNWTKLPDYMPEGGWIKTLREVMNMTNSQMARRMNVSRSMIHGYEHSEVKGVITMSTLKRAAEALNCRVVYALVPQSSLEKTYQDQKRFAARCKIAKSFSEKMDEENPDLERFVTGLVGQIKGEEVWGE